MNYEQLSFGLPTKIKVSPMVKVVTYYKAYDALAYLAEVGGYLGIFVGLSIFDLLCAVG